MTTAKQTADSGTAPWEYAGLMLSYWCSARCEFCYVSSCPNHTHWAEADRVINWWHQLEALANRFGKHVKIHLTGGEAFGNWDLLIKILERVNDTQLPPLEKIETNAFWAFNSKIVEDRLSVLKNFGVTLITTDADVFHQQYIPIENVRRLVEGARLILGEESVRVRWWDFYNFVLENKIDIAALASDQLREIQIDALMNGRERLNGRAAVLASKLIAGKAPEVFAGESCRRGILKSKHVHIDPYGNIFPGTCCGIILGNAISENIADVYDWLDTKGPTGPIIPTLAEKGPAGLIDFASRNAGSKPLPGGYIAKCQLCYHIRWSLYHANQCRKWLGPAECYPPVEWPR